MEQIFEVRDRLGLKVNRPSDQCRNVSLIANDCWGGAMYQEFGWEYRSPFVGLYLMAEDFIQLLTDLERYLNSDLRFVASSRHQVGELPAGSRPGYPIGLLGGDVEIRFVHYRNEDEVVSKWSRRLKRLNWNQLVVKFATDKDGCTPQLIEQFEQLEFSKRIAFSKNPYPGLEHVIAVPRYVDNGAMMFRRSLGWFDFPVWLESGKILRRTPRVLASRMLYRFHA